LIHSTAYVGPDVKLGNNVSIGHHSVITGKVSIGSNTSIGAFASIGEPAQHRSEFAGGEIIIGDNNIIREFVTIHQPINSITLIGNHNYIMAYAHISHDTIIEDHVTISNAVQLGGHCRVMRGANIGLGALVHQHQIIGAYSMVGMGSIITKHLSIKPGRIYAGSPARFLKFNTVGLDRNKISVEELQGYEDRFYLLREALSDIYPIAEP